VSVREMLVAFRCFMILLLIIKSALAQLCEAGSTFMNSGGISAILMTHICIDSLCFVFHIGHEYQNLNIFFSMFFKNMWEILQKVKFLFKVMTSSRILFLLSVTNWFYI